MWFSNIGRSALSRTAGMKCQQLQYRLRSWPSASADCGVSGCNVPAWDASLAEPRTPAPEDARVQPGNCFPGWQRHTARACGQQAFGILPPASQASLLSRLGRTAASRSAPRTHEAVTSFAPSLLLRRLRLPLPLESVHAMGCLVTIEQHVPTPALWLPAPSRSSELSPG